MKYYVRTLASSATIGPYSLGEIEARLQTGELSVDALATEDTGESQTQTASWLCVHQLPGIGGNPAMPSLESQRLPTSSNSIRSSSGSVGFGANCCPTCSAPMTAGEARCRKCDEPDVATVKKPAAAPSLVVQILLVLSGLMVTYFSFGLVLRVFGLLGGGYKSSQRMLVLGGVIHCIGMIAFAVRLIRNSAVRGLGFGILIGALLSGLLTATCAMAKY